MRYFSEAVTTPAYRVTQKLTGVECDVCYKVIPAGAWNEEHRYYEVTTGHNDWGNDSVESIETADVCPECIGKFITDYLRDASDTAYLRLETECSWNRTKHEKVVNKPPEKGEVTKLAHDWY